MPNIEECLNFLNVEPQLFVDKIIDLCIEEVKNMPDTISFTTYDQSMVSGTKQLIVKRLESLKCV